MPVLGGDIKFREKARAINNASRATRDEDKRLNGIHQQLRRFEDAGFGVSTGAQHQHEENMLFYKRRHDEKKKKAKEFKKMVESNAFEVAEVEAAATPCHIEEASASLEDLQREQTSERQILQERDAAEPEPEAESKASMIWHSERHEQSSIRATYWY